MSPVYAYAVVAEEPAPPLGEGLAGEPLRLVRCGEVLIVAGEMATAPVPSPETLAAHDAVVRRLAERMDALLPVRFGERARDEGELSGLLQARAPELSEALERVRGCGQMTLRVFGEPDPSAPIPAPEGGPGTRYLETRRREAERARSLPEIAPLLDRLRPLLKAERVERRESSRLVGAAYHLVRRQDVPAYLAAVRESENLLDGRRVTVSGPWPPYAFAGRLGTES